MKTYKLLLVSLGVLYFTSCEKELDRDLTDVSVSVATNENVRYEGNILTVKRELLLNSFFMVIRIMYLSSVVNSDISIFTGTERNIPRKMLNHVN